MSVVLVKGNKYGYFHCHNEAVIFGKNYIYCFFYFIGV